MKLEEYGKEHDKTLVMLHGAHFVHSFGRQYPLAEKYHIIVPHIMGFGAEADRVFDTETCVSELAEYIAGRWAQHPAGLLEKIQRPDLLNG